MENTLPIPEKFLERNVAVDILRALTMLLMIFVNDLWMAKGEPEWLGHAASDEDFLGLADTVFPCFLFVVGMSIPYAIEKRFSQGKSGVSTVAHILTRSLALLIMGLFAVNTEGGISKDTGLTMPVFRLLMIVAFFLVWNNYPKTKSRSKTTYFVVLQIIGLALLVYLAIIFRNRNGNVMQPSWWGILGLIGWSYLVCAFVYLFARSRIKYLLTAWIVLIVLCLLKSNARIGEPFLNLPRGNAFDAMLDIFRIGNGAHPALTMGGVLLSTVYVKYLSSEKYKKYLYFGAAFVALFAAGFISHSYFITSKIQATPPWVLYCSAISVAMYALLMWLVEQGKA
ncbi:MAG: DUF5009 domain-containing protein, partial [Dysgonamonadaceae bacterium]|nr:DUF5009 domain-containing protein [Dysgonamonadaceae bacterium]